MSNHEAIAHVSVRSHIGVVMEYIRFLAIVFFKNTSVQMSEVRNRQAYQLNMKPEQRSLVMQRMEALT